MDNLEQDGDITLQAAARRLGVHYQTAYRWVRTGVLPARKVDGGYRLTPADVEVMVGLRQARRPLEYTGRARDWDRMREQLHGAIVGGDDTAARRVFEMVHLARVPILEQCEQLLAPSLQRIGDEYVAGELSGARVRIAAGVCERVLDWAVGRVDPAPATGNALVVTPKGDDHRLPALMAAAVLRDSGWSVREVQGIASSEIVDLAGRIRPALAVVSVTIPEVSEAAAEIEADVRESLGIPVLVGGAGMSLRTLHDSAQAVLARG